MTADRLREAAALMRERAEAATTGRWAVENRVILVAPEPVGGDTVNVILGHVNQPGIAENERNAAHIASWHPAVALAVADWLEREAEEHDRYVSQAIRNNSVRLAYANDRAAHALAVARAYLGAES